VHVAGNKNAVDIGHVVVVAGYEAAFVLADTQVLDQGVGGRGKEPHSDEDQIGVECLVNLDVIEGGEFDIELRVIGLYPDDIIVPVPGQFLFLLTDPEMVLWLEMSSDGPVAASEESWGDIKNRYR